MTHAGLVSEADVVLGVELYIIAPRAVIVTVEKVKLLKSHTAVLLSKAGSIEVKLAPPDE